MGENTQVSIDTGKRNCVSRGNSSQKNSSVSQRELESKGADGRKNGIGNLADFLLSREKAKKKKRLAAPKNGLKKCSTKRPLNTRPRGGRRKEVFSGCISCERGKERIYRCGAQK